MECFLVKLSALYNVFLFVLISELSKKDPVTSGIILLLLALPVTAGRDLPETKSKCGQIRLPGTWAIKAGG